MTGKKSELPTSWVVTNLGDICEQPQYGWTTKASGSGNLHLLRTTDITKDRVDWSTVPYCSDAPPDKKKYLLKDGDILISRAGSVGFSYLVKDPEESVFASYLIRFRTFIDEKYLSYFLKSPSYWDNIQEKKLGIAVPNVNASKLREIPVNIPPLSEQHRIVNKIEELFTQLDAGVDLLQKTKLLLNQYRQSVLKAAFEGRLTEEWRQRNKKQIQPLRESLLSFLDDKTVDEVTENHRRIIKERGELSKLPDDWVWIKLSVISNAIGGFAFKSSEYSESGYQVLKIGNVKMNRIDPSVKPTFIDNLDEEIIGRYRLKQNDIVITLTGTRKKRDYGYVAIVKSDGKLLLNQRVARLRFNPIFDAHYFLYALQGEYFQNNFFRYETGNVGQGNVSMRAITDEHIQLPSIPEQGQIVSEIERHFSLADHIQDLIVNTTAKSESIRKGILSKAFKGKLVPQDPSDEPASKLLERLKVQRSAETPRGRKPRQTKMF